jgi:hypothetical protein
MNNNETHPPLSAFTNVRYVNDKCADILRAFDNKSQDSEAQEVPVNTTYEDITYDYTDKEIKEIVKGKAYVSMHKSPVTIAYNFPYKKNPYTARMTIFKSLDEMKNFIDKNRGIVILTMFKRKDGTRYGMRSFDGLKFCCRLEYWYSNFLFFKLDQYKWKIINYFNKKIKQIFGVKNDLSTI